MFTRRSRAIVAVLTGATLSVTCGGSPAAVPGSGDMVSLIPTVTVPATPAESPTVPPASLSACDRIGYGDPRATCGPGAARLVGDVNAAIDRLFAAQPELFDPGAVAPWGDPRVIDQDQYYAALLAELDAAGVCAVQKTDSMVISVKSNNDWSEEYQPLTSQRFPWRGMGSYVAGCSPASFPRAPIERVDYIFVTAYGFKCDPTEHDSLASRGSRPTFPLTCDAHVTATPKTFDHVDVPLSIHGADIEWNLEEGNVSFDQWSSEPFNVTVRPSGPGPVRLCATVQGVRGCLSGRILVPPTPAP